MVMKRFILLLLVVALAGAEAAPALAKVRRVIVNRGPNRARVVVGRGWPLKRPLPVVTVRPMGHESKVKGLVYLAPIVWVPAAIELPKAAHIAWQDDQSLMSGEDWTEFTLNVDSTGKRLDLEIEGRVQLDFAEVVFENGETQVVDFAEKTHGSGVYRLFGFNDDRLVDRIRVVALAKSDEAEVTLYLEK
jgi:hypothetical protein